MRKSIFLALCILIVLGLVLACNTTGSTRAGGFNPGTYLAVGSGRGGPIPVEVEFSKDAIKSIRVLGHNESYHIGNVPVETYPALIVEHQSLAVDIVSGATISSFAVLNAVRDAVVMAGGNPGALNTRVRRQTDPAENVQTDVVVIGGGAAGLTAAIEAARAGSKVILVEKLSILGGTSTYVIEGFGAVESGVQRAIGVPSTWQTWHNVLANNNPHGPGGTSEAFEILTRNSGGSVNWLRSIGALLTVTGGATSMASSREVGILGETIVGALMLEAKKAGVEVRLNTKALELVITNGAATGVRVENSNGTYTIQAKSVVMATGGFAANNEMVAQFQPHLKGFPFSSSPGATGDGHRMAEAAGANLRQMDYVRVNFGYHNKQGIVYYTASITNTGGIFVNNNGVRVINENGGYFAGPEVAVNHGGEGWAVFDRSLIESVQDVRKYYNLGLFISASSLEELADKMPGLNKANFLRTVENYKGFVAQGRDQEFNRPVLNMTFDKPPFYAIRFNVHVQGTFGGIHTNLSTQALRANGAVIPNLFAAGECASVGTYGANPMSTNITFGRIAGQSAAANAR